MQDKNTHGMTLIVKTVTRLTLGFILLYGIYIALTGHISPGGGFAGGVIVALSFVHIMLAFGKEVSLKWLHASGLRIILGISAFVFLVCVMFKMPHWLKSHEIIMPLMEMTVVASGLFAIFVSLVLLSKSDKDSE